MSYNKYLHPVSSGNIDESSDGFSLLRRAHPDHADHRASRMAYNQIDDIPEHAFEILNHNPEVINVVIEAAVMPCSSRFESTARGT